MNGGAIEQIGSPEDIFNRPVSRFVADFVGSANMIEGRVAGTNANGTMNFETKAGTIVQCAPGNPHATMLALRSSYVHLKPDETNRVPGTIHRRMFHGDFMQYVIDWPDGQLIVRRPPTERLEEGADIVVSFSPDYCVLL